LRTGCRGLAEEAPRTSGIPTPPTDQWEQLPVDTVEVDASSGDTSIADDLQDGTIVLVDVGSVPSHDEPARSQQLAALDARLGEVLESAGSCDAAELPPTLLVSVAATDPQDPERMERTGAGASRTAGLQVALASAPPRQALPSGPPKQTGEVRGAGGGWREGGRGGGGGDGARAGGRPRGEHRASARPRPAVAGRPPRGCARAGGAAGGGAPPGARRDAPGSRLFPSPGVDRGGDV